MLENKSILAIIPSRAGSKELPNKNILSFAGNPLIEWSIIEAIKSEYIDDIAISSDDKNVLEIATKYKIKHIIDRPPELATDTASIIDVIIQTIEYLEKKEFFYDIVLLLQATSPLRNYKNINESLEKFISNDFDSLVSIREGIDKIYWGRKINNSGYLENFFDINTNYDRRQDLPKLYYPNGAIYISTISKLKEFRTFEPVKTGFYMMDYFSSIDIDTSTDFEIAEMLFSHKNTIID